MAIMSFENTKGKKLLKEDANYSKEQKEALQELQQLNDYWSSEIMKFHLQACLEDEAEKLRNPLSPKSLIIGIVLMVVWFIPVTTVFGLFTLYVWYFRNYSAAFITFFIMLLLDFPAFIPFIYRAKKSKERENEYLKVGREQYEVSEKLDSLYKNYCENNKCSVPRKYVNPYYLIRLADYINEGRANNLEEALNILEEEPEKSQ